MNYSIEFFATDNLGNSVNIYTSNRDCSMYSCCTMLVNLSMKEEEFYQVGNEDISCRKKKQENGKKR
jgi:hypothetical protein